MITGMVLVAISMTLKLMSMTMLKWKMTMISMAVTTTLTPMEMTMVTAVMKKRRKKKTGLMMPSWKNKRMIMGNKAEEEVSRNQNPKLKHEETKQINLQLETQDLVVSWLPLELRLPILLQPVLLDLSWVISIWPKWAEEAAMTWEVMTWEVMPLETVCCRFLFLCL